jgi:galactose mutarotase-like enzyme
MFYSIENEKLMASFNNSGAELASLYHKPLEKEFIWNGDPRFWGRRAPILFPVIGRLRNDSYHMDGRSFNLGQHGFARDRRFDIVETHGDSMVFHLKETKETLRTYPFPFSLKIRYSLVKDSLTIAFEITNDGNSAMPFSIGGHPGFICPFNSGETLEDYAVFCDEKEECERLFIENGLITGEEKFIIGNKVLPLSEGLFLKDALILKDLNSKKVHLGRLDENGPKIEVSFPGFPYLGLWKKKDAPFVCIEPWFGLPDHRDKETDLFHKEGVIILPPSERFNAEFTISIY